eukprot:TRINITY_DN11352_c0_g1_i5.p1 TRINITY_DN11352_c0_g1~~TRINITY_DN11352_c0_g1_i5.p1  ORF type:complete len:139 (+),score=8.31 TRINITY_DN11352_c0_g1_i5:105-521(+)
MFFLTRPLLCRKPMSWTYRLKRYRVNIWDARKYRMRRRKRQMRAAEKKGRQVLVCPALPGGEVHPTVVVDAPRFSKVLEDARARDWQQRRGQVLRHVQNPQAGGKATLPEGASADMRRGVVVCQQEQGAVSMLLNKQP